METDQARTRRRRGVLLKNTYSIELFFVCMFFCVALFLSLAVETFARQRRAIVLAKRKTEDDLEKLTAAKKAADSANVAKSDFLANMSHEFRTPLNHIIGFTELVVDKNFGGLNAIQEEYLGDVLQSSRHLLSLINDILDLSKVEAGRLELEVSNVALRPLLENSLTIVQEKAAKEGIELVTDLGLALAKRLVELHGGRIWAESKGAGHGSTFLFRLPVRTGDETE